MNGKKGPYNSWIALAILAIFFVLAGLYMANNLLAQTGAKNDIPATDMPEGENISPAQRGTVDGATPGVAASEPNFPDIMESLRLREEAVRNAERQIEDQRRELLALKRDVEENIRQLETARKQLQDTYENADKERVKTLRRLAPAYERMQPEAAAVAVAGLETSEAVELLKLIDTKRTSKILDSLVETNPEKAIEITQSLHRTVQRP